MEENFIKIREAWGKRGVDILEEWWRHNGCYDREQASGIPFVKENGNDTAEYLTLTDEWWGGLTDEMKQEVYDDFFCEN